MNRYRIAAGCSVLAAAFCVDARASCGSAFCLVNTDWSVQGLWAEPGTRFGLRYESVDLDQPRAGRDRVSVGEIPRDHDEIATRNRNWVASVDGAIAAGWGYSVSMPFVDRRHSHVHHDGDEAVVESWNFARPGDLKATARYELGAGKDPFASQATGLVFGLKLPTGAHDVKNGEGEAAERTLQPGTGTADLIAGIYWRGTANADTAWFAQIQGTAPLNSRDAFKPGRTLQIDAGFRYAASQTVGLMLQVNAVVKGRDSGANAEPEDSGQRQVWLSPGVSWNLARDAQVHVFVQLPLYQAVNGVQLTADRSWTAGASWRF